MDKNKYQYSNNNDIEMKMYRIFIKFMHFLFSTFIIVVENANSLLIVL